MKSQNVLILVLLVSAASVALTRRYWPAYKVQTTTHETVVTKVVTKIKHVKTKDGTETTETEIVDTGREDRQRTDTVKPLPKWHASVGILSRFNREAPNYELQLERRVLGPFGIGLSARTDGTLGAHLGMEF